MYINYTRQIKNIKGKKRNFFVKKLKQKKVASEIFSVRDYPTSEIVLSNNTVNA